MTSTARARQRALVHIPAVAASPYPLFHLTLDSAMQQRSCAVLEASRFLRRLRTHLGGQAAFGYLYTLARCIDSATQPGHHMHLLVSPWTSDTRSLLNERALRDLTQCSEWGGFLLTGPAIEQEDKRRLLRYAIGHHVRLSEDHPKAHAPLAPQERKYTTGGGFWEQTPRDTSRRALIEGQTPETPHAVTENTTPSLARTRGGSY